MFYICVKFRSTKFDIFFTSNAIKFGVRKLLFSQPNSIIYYFYILLIVFALSSVIIHFFVQCTPRAISDLSFFFDVSIKRKWPLADSKSMMVARKATGINSLSFNTWRKKITLFLPYFLVKSCFTKNKSKLYLFLAFWTLTCPIQVYLDLFIYFW